MNVIVGILCISSVIAVATTIYFGFYSEQFDRFTKHFLQRNLQVSRPTMIIGYLWLVSVAVVVILFIILSSARMP